MVKITSRCNYIDIPLKVGGVGPENHESTLDTYLMRLSVGRAELNTNLRTGIVGPYQRYSELHLLDHVIIPGEKKVDLFRKVTRPMPHSIDLCPVESRV